MNKGKLDPAALAVAAPDLYAALVSCVCAIRAYTEDDEYGEDMDVQGIIASAEKALHKAETTPTDPAERCASCNSVFAEGETTYHVGEFTVCFHCLPAASLPGTDPVAPNPDPHEQS